MTPFMTPFSRLGILEAIRDAPHARVALNRLKDRFPAVDPPIWIDEVVAFDQRWAWVELPAPRAPLFDILESFLENHADVEWTYQQYSRVGFLDPKHAVMFKLMLP